MDTNRFEYFETRHNGSNNSAISSMLDAVKSASLSELIKETIPANILLHADMSIGTAESAYTFLQDFKKLAERNQVLKSYIGMGYYDCITPSVILRNILENPGWYTAYTPYQAEIAQGRLEMLVNFQTMVTDLTAMEIANASLLDEATAAAEAMSLLFAVRDKRSKKEAKIFIVDEHTHPQIISVLSTRARPLGIELFVSDCMQLDLTRINAFGVLLQYPDTVGNIKDWTVFIENAHEQKVNVAVGADLLSLTLLKPPGEMGADVVFGSTQRLGLPMGFGGPHAAFFATKEIYKRQLPGRIIGISKDASGRPAYRMALQTREQHIRRDKATSNICTAQVLPAVIAAAYVIWHGAEGLKRIAERVRILTRSLHKNLSALGLEVVNEYAFDTITIKTDQFSKDDIATKALAKGMNFRYFVGDYIGISLGETTLLDDVKEIVGVFEEALLKKNKWLSDIESNLPIVLQRTGDFLMHSVFSSYHSEHEMLRYLKRLENKDLSLTHSMIALGSCTMKLNATTEMIPLTWPEFGGIHPFAPSDQVQGYNELFDKLSRQLCEITGFESVSLQPNSGAQGEYTGLMVIRAYHRSRGDLKRNIALVPQSAHGTNPASAIMAGMEVVLVKCDERGNIDFQDLENKSAQYSDNLAVLMITYPSTHGVFETEIQNICILIHQHGGRVYMDGANMNAQVGLTNPAIIGADVCHLNLHKTFCIPHGGGGPGMGPIAVTKELASFLPTHLHLRNTDNNGAISAVSAAPWGSASILTISYAYITMMGAKGLRSATTLAILNANYIKTRLEGHYEVLYSGESGRVAHEMILDCRAFKSFGIEVEDIAKRLMDYGYHAPTVSFPVAGTLMIEPTESESKAALDLFCEVMISIREEIREVEKGEMDIENNVLKNAPHTAEMLISVWDKPYSKEKAVYPLPHLREDKFWPSVRRVDNAYGDRNLFCTCYAGNVFEQEVES